MTEPEWLAATSSKPMMEFIRDKASGRKLRLFVCACYRPNWWLMSIPRFCEVMEAAERWADGQATFDEVNALADRVDDHPDFEQEKGVWWPAQCLAAEPPDGAAFRAAFAFVGEDHRGIGRPNSDGIRCIFGNPFRPSTLDPTCLTPAVNALARQMYESRDFTLMPILADALQDAGCDDAQVLNHCREGGVHVRGCWVVDAVLGKS